MKDRPDPILQQAAKEIADICDKHNIGGYIILASQTNGEYLMHFPQWSKCFLETQPNGDTAIRFKSKAKEDKELVTATIHMMQVFQMQGLNIAKGMDYMLEMIESRMLIGGGPKRIKSD